MQNPKQIAVKASVSDYLFVFFLIHPKTSAHTYRWSGNRSGKAKAKHPSFSL